MAAALRRLVLPTISRGRLAPRHPTPSFTGAATTKTGQVRIASISLHTPIRRDFCTKI
jgi:hypothetical protein